MPVIPASFKIAATDWAYFQPCSSASGQISTLGGGDLVIGVQSASFAEPAPPCEVVTA